MTADNIIALVTLTLMEIVLGIDNIIFMAIVSGRLPKEQQAKARRIGLVVALATRLALLGTLFFLTSLEKVNVFYISSLGIPESLMTPEINAISVKDLVLLLGGAFLIAKSTTEIHHKLEGDEHEGEGGGKMTFTSALVQIAVLDVVFSLDSVITAVGMAREPWVMVVAMILAVGVMLVFAGSIADFVGRHPTVKVLALAFLILIGVMLVAEGLGQHISKGYIYFAMAFSVVVEMINIRVRTKSKGVELRDDKMPSDAPTER